MREFKVGDKVWWVPGYGGCCLVAIQCTITEIDDWARKRSPYGHLLYRIDEPVGHSLAEDDFHETRDQAVKQLVNCVEAEDMCRNANDPPTTLDGTIEQFRISRAKFVVSTWRDVPDSEKDVDKILAKYPKKVHGLEWFNPSDLAIVSAVN